MKSMKSVSTLRGSPKKTSAGVSSIARPQQIRRRIYHRWWLVFFTVGSPGGFRRWLRKAVEEPVENKARAHRWGEILAVGVFMLHPGKIHVEPENDGFQKESPLPGVYFFYKLQWSKNFTFDVGYRWCILGYLKTPEMTSEQKIPLGQWGPFWFLGFSDFEAKLQDVLFPGLNGLVILQILIHHWDAFVVFIYDRNLGNHGESKWIECVFYVSIVFLHWHGRNDASIETCPKKKNREFDSDASRLLIWMRTRRHNYHSMWLLTRHSMWYISCRFAVSWPDSGENWHLQEILSESKNVICPVCGQQVPSVCNWEGETCLVDQLVTYLSEHHLLSETATAAFSALGGWRCTCE